MSDIKPDSLSPVDSPEYFISKKDIAEKRKEIVGITPVDRSSPVASLYKEVVARTEAKKRAIDIDLSPTDPAVARLYQEPSEPPEKLASSVSVSLPPPEKLYHEPTTSPEAMPNRWQRWLEKLARVVGTKKMPKPIAPMPEAIATAVKKEKQLTQLTLAENARDLLKRDDVMDLIKIVKTLRSNGNETERVTTKSDGTVTDYARLVDFARKQFPLNERAEIYELVFRFLLPGQNAQDSGITKIDFAEMQGQMLFLSEALIDSQFNGKMPPLIVNGLTLYEAYSLTPGELSRRNDLLDNANTVLYHNNQRTDSWRGIDPQIRQHFVGIASSIVVNFRN